MVSAVKRSCAFSLFGNNRIIPDSRKSRLIFFILVFFGGAKIHKSGLGNFCLGYLAFIFEAGNICNIYIAHFHKSQNGKKCPDSGNLKICSFCK